LRGIEAGLQAQLADHRAELWERLQDSARASEESALRRAEALLAPPLAALKEHLGAELPSLQRSIEALAAESRHESQALRAELGTEVAQLRSELSKLREEVPELSARIRQNAEAVSGLEAARQELWLASEAVRASVREAVGALDAKLLEKAEHAAQASEKRWCGPLSERIAAAEAALREVDARAKAEASTAVDTAKAVQDLLLCRVEELRLQASRDSRMHAAEAAAGLREEVLKGDILERFQQRLHESSVCLEARIAALQAKLCEEMEASAAGTLALAERGSEARASTLAAQIFEAVQATRQDVQAQAQSHAEALAECRQQLRDASRNFDAADALTRSSLEALRSRAERHADEAAELRQALASARRAALEDVAAVRAQLQQAALRWRSFEEVGVPALLAQMEHKAGESEIRSAKAALDYAERLRRLPAPIKATPAHMPGATEAPAWMASSVSELAWRPQEPPPAIGARPPEAGSDFAAQPALPPLTPMSARKRQGQL